VQFVWTARAHGPYLRAPLKVRRSALISSTFLKMEAAFTFCASAPGAPTEGGKIQSWFFFQRSWPVTLKAWRSSNSTVEKAEASASKNAAPAGPHPRRSFPPLPPEESSINCGDWIRPGGAITACLLAEAGQSAAH